MSDPWFSIDLGERVQAIQTHRGVSNDRYGAFNLGLHVGDEVARVQAAREQLGDYFGATPVFADQVHGVRVVEVGSCDDVPGEADALVTRALNVPLGVLTADCLPVLFVGHDAVGAAHAGWRGLVSGVLEATVSALPTTGVIRAWLGPCIGPNAFEVGPEVVSAFLEWDPAASRAMRPSSRSGHAYLDLPRLAEARLNDLGVVCQTAGACTVNEPSRWYSYRREGVTGRMASCIMRTG